MSKIKAIIFDYDGVIAESVNVKTEAFAELYRHCGDKVVQNVVNHHEANGGISRFEKFRIYHNEFLGKEIDDIEVEELASQFSNLVLQKVIDSQYVTGAYEFIVANYENYEFFISTGTPTSEIEIILKNKNIKKYFVNIFGSPEKKDIHVAEIMMNNKFQNDEIIFIGDAITDRNAAINNGIRFIGRYTTTEEIKNEKYLINDFRDLNAIINKIENE
jgi:HAD superfamily hydrolase (TIGR01549 family)